MPEGGDVEGIREIAIRDLIDFWKPIEDALQTRDGPFMLGKKISLLDIFITMLVTWYQPMEELLEMYPALKKCYEESSKYPSVAKGIAMQSKVSVGVI